MNLDVCTHPDGRSHICRCGLNRNHSSLETGCRRYTTHIGSDEESKVPFVGEVHNYESDAQSGAGNCKICNDAFETRQHPHPYRQARDYVGCVCGLKRSALVHQMRRI